MSSVTIPDETFDRLTKQAAALNISIEQLITPLLELAAGDINGQFKPTPNQSFDDWKTNFDSWMTEVNARTGRYPPGFAMDDSRESIYEGCGE